MKIDTSSFPIVFVFPSLIIWGGGKIAENQQKGGAGGSRTRVQTRKP
ncbi:MAG: hypothetical protein J5637_07730 [Prevotella sp.]|nr:hypothetical protein [Prevotella sp.]